MKKIELTRGKTNWFANFCNDKAIESAFGTTKIPLPFTQKATDMEVATEIRRNNPYAKVVVLR